MMTFDETIRFLGFRKITHSPCFVRTVSQAFRITELGAKLADILWSAKDGEIIPE
jgi:hypothetical protein